MREIANRHRHIIAKPCKHSIYVKYQVRVGLGSFADQGNHWHLLWGMAHFVGEEVAQTSATSTNRPLRGF
jgi:hypothetical protein